MSTAQDARDILQGVIDTLQSRDAEYRGSDKLYADVMAVLFPQGFTIDNARDHHRAHLFMLMIIKVTRYARNWREGHPDSLIDLAAYSAMLAALDREGA